MTDKDGPAKPRVKLPPVEEMTPYEQAQYPTQMNDEPWVPRFSWKRKLVGTVGFGRDFKFFVGHRSCVVDRATGKRVSEWMDEVSAWQEARKRDEAAWDEARARGVSLDMAEAELEWAADEAARSARRSLRTKEATQPAQEKTEPPR